MKEIKVGDKVRCTYPETKNYEGKVVFINTYNYCAVDFGRDFSGHHCRGHIESNTGWWCHLSTLELIEDTKKEIKVGDRVLHSKYHQEATVTAIIDDDMVKIAFDHNFKEIKPCNYKSYYAFIWNLQVIESTPTETQAEPIRDPETGSLSCCEPDACVPVSEVPEEDVQDCPQRALSCCLDEVPVVPERYFDAHYDGDVQPIELMQMILTPEQFIGFLMGNIIKYSMRCGKKDAPEKELTKIRRYKAWLDQARNGEIINPRV